MWADLIVLTGTVAVQNVAVTSSHHHPQTTLKWLFYPGRSDATDGAGWEALSFQNAEPPTMVQQAVNRHALRTRNCRVAMSRISHRGSTPSMVRAPFTAASASPDNSDDDGKIMIHLVPRQVNDLQTQALKHYPPFQRWVEYYLDAGDTTYVQDFVATCTKSIWINRQTLPPPTTFVAAVTAACSSTSTGTIVVFKLANTIHVSIVKEEGSKTNNSDTTIAKSL